MSNYETEVEIQALRNALEGPRAIVLLEKIEVSIQFFYGLITFVY